MTPGVRRFALGALIAAATTGLAVATLAADIRVVQKGRAFDRKEITIARGDVLHFLNADEFIHQIYVESKDFNFDSAESEPGDTINLRFKTPGTFEVHCHIHPKMRLVVTVK